MTGWTRLLTGLLCQTTPMSHRLTYRASTLPLLRPMLLLPQLVATRTRQPIHQGIRHRPDRIPLLAPSRCQDETAAGRLSPDLIVTPLCPSTTSELRTRDRQGTISASTSHGASRPETETEDDGDGDLDMDPVQETTDNSPERPQTSPLTRCAVAIVSDIRTDTGAGQFLELNSDAHIIINSEVNRWH